MTIKMDILKIQTRDDYTNGKCSIYLVGFNYRGLSSELDKYLTKHMDKEDSMDKPERILYQREIVGAISRGVTMTPELKCCYTMELVKAWESYKRGGILSYAN
jgi:hypothetical protein